MYPFAMKENEHDDADALYFGIVGLISIPITALFIMDEKTGGWTLTNILLAPFLWMICWAIIIFFIFVAVKIPYIIFIRTPYRLFTGKAIMQKKICPFCNEEVVEWFSREHAQCLEQFNKEFELMKKNISQSITKNEMPNFENLAQNSSEIFQHYLHTQDGKNYVKVILLEEFEKIQTLSDAQTLNEFTKSIAKNFETSKSLLLEEFDDEGDISAALLSAFNKVITPMLDDFLVDDQESKDLESLYAELVKIMPLNLVNLGNRDNFTGIIYGNQLYRLKNDLELNKIDLPSGILLQKNEIPIMNIYNVSCHLLNVKTKYRGRSTGGSYRLSSKLTIRHSEHRGRPISYSEWDRAGTGDLILTNKHLYFLGDGSARDHKEKLSSIISFDPTSDGFIVNLNFKTRPAVRFQMDEREAFYCTNMLSLAQ